MIIFICYRISLSMFSYCLVINVGVSNKSYFYIYNYWPVYTRKYIKKSSANKNYVNRVWCCCHGSTFVNITANQVFSNNSPGVCIIYKKKTDCNATCLVCRWMCFFLLLLLLFNNTFLSVYIEILYISDTGVRIGCRVGHVFFN